MFPAPMLSIPFRISRHLFVINSLKDRSKCNITELFKSRAHTNELLITQPISAHHLEFVIWKRLFVCLQLSQKPLEGAFVVCVTTMYHCGISSKD